MINGEDSMLKQLLAYGAKPDLQVINSKVVIVECCSHVVESRVGVQVNECI